MTELNIGRFYILRSNKTSNIFIGATKKSLKDMLIYHKYIYNKYKDEKRNKYIQSFEVLKYDDCYIELITEMRL